MCFAVSSIGDIRLFLLSAPVLANTAPPYAFKRGQSHECCVLPILHFSQASITPSTAISIVETEDESGRVSLSLIEVDAAPALSKVHPKKGANGNTADPPTWYKAPFTVYDITDW